MIFLLQQNLRKVSPFDEANCKIEFLKCLVMSGIYSSRG